MKKHVELGGELGKMTMGGLPAACWTDPEVFSPLCTALGRPVV